MRPKDHIIEIVAGFFKVKTVITLVIVFTFCFKALQGAELSDAFIMIATAVVTYYFCKDTAIEERIKQHEETLHRKDDKNHEENLH